MIYDKHKLIQIAIPKTGTNCIFNLVHGFDNLIGINPGKINYNKNVIDVGSNHPLWFYYAHGHIAYKFYKQMIKENPKYKDYKIFTFVRNPYDLVVSLFYVYTVKMGRKVNFEQFCEQFMKSKNHNIINNDNNVQTNYLIDNVGENITDIDFIGKIENIEDDWVKLKEMVPTLPDYDPKYGQSNVRKRNSKRDDFMGYYNDNTRNFIYNLYKNDFENFNYEK